MSERFCLECGAWIPDGQGRSKCCSERCRDARKRTVSGSVESRHACLLRVLHREKCKTTDPLFSINYYERLLGDSRCLFCRGPMSPSGHGLDRIDNNKGHVAANVLQGPVCGDCNSIRGANLSVEHMYRLSPALIDIRIELEDEKQYHAGKINKAELDRRKEVKSK